jgi:hypothetical protein
MKTFILKTLLILFLAAGAASCRSHKPVASSSPRHLPPGHAKKLYGHRSARAFAPGQRKKVVVVQSKQKTVVKQKPKKKGKKN